MWRGAHRSMPARAAGPTTVTLAGLDGDAYGEPFCHGRNREMTPSQALPAVLERIDADLDRSLERLFEFLRIQSISTDPAYQAQCRAAADFVAGDLRSLG